MNFNMIKYRENTQYDNVFKYVAPDGYHWESFGTNYGKVIWGGKDLSNPYLLVKNKDKKDEKN